VATGGRFRHEVRDERPVDGEEGARPGSHEDRPWDAEQGRRSDRDDGHPHCTGRARDIDDRLAADAVGDARRWQRRADRGDGHDDLGEVDPEGSIGEVETLRSLEVADREGQQEGRAPQDEEL
jgi:hypothetical protein